MPKNKFGGKKHKRGKKTIIQENKETIYASKNEVYALVLKRLGGTRLYVECSDGKNRQAVIPGKFRKRVWMRKDDIILCYLGALGNDDTCEVIHKYNNKEITDLITRNLLSFKNFHIHNYEEDEEEESNIAEQREILDIDDIPSEDEEDGSYDSYDSDSSDYDEDLTLDDL
jgi:translation initiation factor 1A